MGQDHLKIPIDSVEASWKQRCNERMVELKNIQFPSEDPASKPEQQLLHKELVLEKQVMIFELYKAVENGDVNNFVHVLEQECRNRKLPLSDIFDKVTGGGDSLLHVAADKGKEHIAELICDNFPELLIRRNVRGDTPLHVAVMSKNSAIVNLILSQYATVKSKHDDDLQEALYSGHVAHYLNKSRRSPLFLAVASGNEEILKLLLQIPFPKDQPLPQCFGNSPLHAAIQEQNSDLIGVITDERPELIYLRDEVGNTPLHYAAYNGYVKEFRTLLKKSDHTSFVRNNKGSFPIHLACKMGHVEVVKEFLQSQWPINPFLLLNQKGQNILHVAAKNGKSKVVHCLLKNQEIDQLLINHKDNDENTPLHLASINLFPQIMYIIIQDKRTNMKLTNNDNLTVRDIVSLALGVEMTFRTVLQAGSPKTVNVMLQSIRQPLPKLDSNLKDVINTCLVVATLMVAVTFAAAITVPGGLYSSDDSNPQNRGRAVLVHSINFARFTSYNTTGMFASVIACGLLLLARIIDKLAYQVTFGAMTILGVCFSMVPLAFMYAILLVVHNNSQLARSIYGTIYMYYFIFVCINFFILVPILLLSLLHFHISPSFFGIFHVFIDCDSKPRGSHSHRANKDKDNGKNKDD